MEDLRGVAVSVGIWGNCLPVVVGVGLGRWKVECWREEGGREGGRRERRQSRERGERREVWKREEGER